MNFFGGRVFCNRGLVPYEKNRSFWLHVGRRSAWLGLVPYVEINNFWCVNSITSVRSLYETWSLGLQWTPYWTPKRMLRARSSFGNRPLDLVEVHFQHVNVQHVHRIETLSYVVINWYKMMICDKWSLQFASGSYKMCSWGQASLSKKEEHYQKVPEDLAPR